MHRRKTTGHKNLRPCKILILTGSIGSGHLSVARSIAEALHRLHGAKADVEIVDFITALKNFVTTATKKIYLGSLKLSPKIYELIFSQSSEKEWTIKFLNTLSVPFLQKKFMQLLKEKNPQVLVSTFPLWQILIKKCWKLYRKEKKAPFVSVLTDCLTIHPSWIMGDPDFFAVPNEDTKISLIHLGIPEKKIKVFGYPISHRFFKSLSPHEFEQKWNLSPKKKTLLLILSTGIHWSKMWKLIRTIQKSTLKNLQLLIVSAGEAAWEEKLKKILWPWETRVTGWTKEIHELIHNADIVLTKAGGSTVMECIQCQKPIVIIETLPGQEIGNAVLVQKYNLGVVLNRDTNNFDNAVRYILNHKTLIKKNLAAQQKPHAAENIAKFLLHFL